MVEDQSLMGAASESDAQGIAPYLGRSENRPRENKRPRSADPENRSPPGSSVSDRGCHTEVSSARGGPETIAITGKVLKSGKGTLKSGNGTARRNTTQELSDVEPVTSRSNVDELSGFEHAASPNEMHEVVWNEPATSPKMMQECSGVEPATYQNDMQEVSGVEIFISEDGIWDRSPLDESPLG